MLRAADCGPVTFACGRRLALGYGRQWHGRLELGDGPARRGQQAGDDRAQKFATLAVRFIPDLGKTFGPVDQNLPERPVAMLAT